MPTAESWYKAHGIKKGDGADSQAGQDSPEQEQGQSEESDATRAEAGGGAGSQAGSDSRPGIGSSGFVQPLGRVLALLLVAGAGLLLLVSLFLVLVLRAGSIRVVSSTSSDLSAGRSALEEESTP